MSKTKILALIAIVAVIGALFVVAPDYLNLDFIKSQLNQALVYQQQNPLTSIIIFSLIYIFCTAASIPGALLLTLSAGAIFGFALGTLVALISATIGATLSFLIARYLIGDWVQSKMGERLGKIRDSFDKEGALYLFSMRLVPVFPFFAINLLMAFTPVKVATFFFISFIGMAPGTMVFINAGTQLSKLTSVDGILSAPLIISFVLLAVFPYIAKYMLNFIKQRFSNGE